MILKIPSWTLAKLHRFDETEHYFDLDSNSGKTGPEINKCEPPLRKLILYSDLIQKTTRKVAAKSKSD